MLLDIRAGNICLPTIRPGIFSGSRTGRRGAIKKLVPIGFVVRYNMTEEMRTLRLGRPKNAEKG